MNNKQKSEKPSLIELFLYFLKIGLITFGGGYAIISSLEREVVEKKKWITHEDMINMIVIGESTPGPIAINLATFIGYKMKGFWGSFLCTLGFVVPSFAIITIISVCISQIQNVPVWVAWCFKGIRAGVVVLIGSACVKFFKRMDKHFFAFLMLFLGFFVSFFTDLSVIYLILIGGVLGLVYSLVVARLESKKNGKNSKFTGKNDKNSAKAGENTTNEMQDSVESSIENNALNIVEKASENISEKTDKKIDNFSENSLKTDDDNNSDIDAKNKETALENQSQNEENIINNTPQNEEILVDKTIGKEVDK